MNSKTATIRELRTNFRSVKRRIEQHGQVVITDHGQPTYLLKPLPQRAKERRTPPDYYARLVKRQPKPISDEQTRQFWDQERQ